MPPEPGRAARMLCTRPPRCEPLGHTRCAVVSCTRGLSPRAASCPTRYSRTRAFASDPVGRGSVAIRSTCALARAEAKSAAGVSTPRGAGVVNGIRARAATTATASKVSGAARPTRRLGTLFLSTISPIRGFPSDYRLQHAPDRRLKPWSQVVWQQQEPPAAAVLARTSGIAAVSNRSGAPSRIRTRAPTSRGLWGEHRVNPRWWFRPSVLLRRGIHGHPRRPRPLARRRPVEPGSPTPPHCRRFVLRSHLSAHAPATRPANLT